VHILTPIPRPVRRRRRTSVTRLLAPAAPCALVRPVTILGASPPMNCRARAARQRRERRRHRREYHHDAPTPTRPSARARPASFSSRSTTPRHRFVSFVRSRLTSRLPSPRARVPTTAGVRSLARVVPRSGARRRNRALTRGVGAGGSPEFGSRPSDPSRRPSPKRTRRRRVSRDARPDAFARARSRATHTFQINAFRARNTPRAPLAARREPKTRARRESSPGRALRD